MLQGPLAAEPRDRDMAVPTTRRSRQHFHPVELVNLGVSAQCVRESLDGGAETHRLQRAAEDLR